MCKQKTFSTINNCLSASRTQQGFSLVMVMMVMVIIALLVIAGAQVSNTEMRISTNNADQKFAKGLAEKALLAGESDLLTILFPSKNSAVDENTLTSSGQFETNKCSSGLGGIYTTTLDVPVWEKGGTKSEEDGFVANGKEVSDITGGAKNPRYIIEYLGVKKVDGNEDVRVFRISARAWGKNENTVSTLQTVVVAPSS